MHYLFSCPFSKLQQTCWPHNSSAVSFYTSTKALFPVSIYLTETKLEQNIITDHIIRKTSRVTDHSSLLRIDTSGTLTKLSTSRGSLEVCKQSPKHRYKGGWLRGGGSGAQAAHGSSHLLGSQMQTASKACDKARTSVTQEAFLIF